MACSAGSCRFTSNCLVANVCVVAKGNVLLSILTAGSKSSSSGHHLPQSGHWILNSRTEVGTEKSRGALSHLLSNWDHHWHVMCVLIRCSRNPMPWISLPRLISVILGSQIFCRGLIFSGTESSHRTEFPGCSAGDSSLPCLSQLFGTSIQHILETPSMGQRVSYKV